MASLARFVSAQDGSYAHALAELEAGDKRSHWMWFIFPQIAGLGRSATAQHFAIADLVEARAYLAHDVLGPRLEECTRAMLGWAGRRSAEAILGGIDAMKFWSSMTLFELVGGGAAHDGANFGRALDAFCSGVRDTVTLRLVRR